MKKITAITVSLLIMMGVVAMPTAVVYADAASVIKGGVDEINDGNDVPLEEQIRTIVNIMLFLLGAIAVLMIIIGGIRYATSNGDANNTKAAKDIILYAVVGLVVAILSYAIVGFVLDAFSG